MSGWMAWGGEMREQPKESTDWERALLLPLSEGKTNDEDSGFFSAL